MTGSDKPMVWLAPDDARTAQTAGIEFARTLAGAPSDWFALALEDQEAIIRDAIRPWNKIGAHASRRCHST